MSKLPPSRIDRKREISREVWPEADLVPNIGEAIAQFSALAGDLKSTVSDVRGPVDRASVHIALTSVVADFLEAYSCEEPLDVTVPLLLRVMHQTGVILASMGIHGKRLNALLTRFLADEMARVDPSLGFLDDNNREPYRAFGVVVDPPGYENRLKSGTIRDLNKILMEDSKKSVDYVEEP